MSLGKWGSGAEVLRVRRFGVEGSAWGFRDLPLYWALEYHALILFS